MSYRNTLQNQDLYQTDVTETTMIINNPNDSVNKFGRGQNQFDQLNNNNFNQVQPQNYTDFPQSSYAPQANSNPRKSTTNLNQNPSYNNNNNYGQMNNTGENNDELLRELKITNKRIEDVSKEIQNLSTCIQKSHVPNCPLSNNKNIRDSINMGRISQVDNNQPENFQSNNNFDSARASNFQGNQPNSFNNNNFQPQQSFKQYQPQGQQSQSKQQSNNNQGYNPTYQDNFEKQSSYMNNYPSQPVKQTPFESTMSQSTQIQNPNRFGSNNNNNFNNNNNYNTNYNNTTNQSQFNDDKDKKLVANYKRTYVKSKGVEFEEYDDKMDMSKNYRAIKDQQSQEWRKVNQVPESIAEVLRISEKAKQDADRAQGMNQGNSIQNSYSDNSYHIQNPNQYSA